MTIPGGSFIMGSNQWANMKFFPSTTPRHKVTIKAFQMAKSTVTNKQYRACVQAGVCTPPHILLSKIIPEEGLSLYYDDRSYFEGDDQPVVGIDWNQAKTFSEWVGGRLPSEAEWEYAARSAGKEWKFPWGDAGATCRTAVMEGCVGRGTKPVCSTPAGNTTQGLCDMAGNVVQWVQDLYHQSYAGQPTDGTAWEFSEGPNQNDRVIRGSSWHSEVYLSGHRFLGDPADQGPALGFRPARSP
ncbi:MAG: formylglycine-generating enzyme family protein [Elusimicrobia bacterium]|nr:formylglycine-generating enzyme family protein [Elusimicrobiota bacterium]